MRLLLETKFSQNPDLIWPSPYSETKPLLAAQTRLHFSDYVYFYIEPSIILRLGREDRSNILGNNFNINIPFNFDETENRIPLRAFGAFGGSWFNFQIGRDKLFWGSANTASLSFSDLKNYFTFARLSFFTPIIKYSIIVNQMPLVLYEDQINLKNHNADWSGPFLKETQNRYFYLHRFDISLFNKFTISLMEGVMAGNAPLELKYLNPVSLFHSFFSWNNYEVWEAAGNEGYMNGSIFSVELNYNVTRSLSLYGQFVMNQASTEEEKNYNPNLPPNALGYLAGLQFSFSINSWSSFFFVEFIYTDPYLYILNSPFASFIHMGITSSSDNNGKGIYSYIGHPRDTLALSLGAKLFNGNNLKIAGVLTWSLKGEHDKSALMWDWHSSPESRAETTPSGKAANNFIFSLDASWKLTDYLNINGGCAGIARDDNEAGFQFTLGIELSPNLR